MINWLEAEPGPDAPKNARDESKTRLPEGSLDLIYYLSETWVDLERAKEKALKSEDIKYFLKMKWPVIQGTNIRLALRRLAKQKANSKLAAKALQELSDLCL